MKQRDVRIGELYVVKVSGKLTRVRVTRESDHGGWDGVNEETGRPVRIRSAARLRGVANQEARGASQMGRKKTNVKHEAEAGTTTVEVPAAVQAEAPATKKRTRASKGTEEAAAEASAPKAAAASEPATDATEDGDQEVVFAFRLSRAQRDLIHAAAGSAKASKFVKGLAVAAAHGDVDGVLAIVTEAKAAKRG